MSVISIFIFMIALNLIIEVGICRYETIGTKDIFSYDLTFNQMLKLFFIIISRIYCNARILYFCKCLQ